MNALRQRLVADASLMDRGSLIFIRSEGDLWRRVADRFLAARSPCFNALRCVTLRIYNSVGARGHAFPIRVLIARETGECRRG